MKRGFTLVELLVVVVVIVTLMAVSFRISKAASSSNAISDTVKRMQRLENCLSGYFAAYGSYPPVAVHGRRDYRYNVNSSGIQRLNSRNESELVAANVRAACRSQPVGFACPFPPGARDIVRKTAALNGMSFDALVDDTFISGHDKTTETDWLEVQVCKLGVLGYLLPRLLVVLDENDDLCEGGNGNFHDGFARLLDCAQWSSNNEKPVDFASGQTYESWKDAKSKGLFSRANRWKVALLPSQSVCARWLENLRGTLANDTYGLSKLGVLYGIKDLVSDDRYNSRYHAYSASGTQGADADSSGESYILREFTVVDGWGNELYYYSPQPYQSYTLWSSGPNGNTFPPWVSDEELKKLDGDDQKLAQKWIADDIVHMKN